MHGLTEPETSILLHLAPVVVSVVTAVYVYGRLTEKVVGVKEWMMRHEAKHAEHFHSHEEVDRRLNEHGERISTLEAKIE